MNLKIKIKKYYDIYNKYFAYTVLLLGILGLTLIFINTDSLRRDMPFAENGTLDLKEWDFKKDGLVKLNGEWEFYYGQLLDYDDFHNDINTANLSGYIKVPGKWNGYNVNGKFISGMGYGTYRLKVHTSGKKNNDDKGIILPYSLTSYKVMIDNNVIYINGRVGKDKNSSISELNTRNVSFNPNSKDFEIILQISNFCFYNGGTHLPIYMGNYEDILFKDKNSSLKDMFLFSSLMIMGLYHIVLYIFLPKKKYTLYFGLLCLIIALRIIFTCETILISNFMKINYNLFKYINYEGFFLGIICMCNFLYEMYPDDFSRKVFKIIISYSMIWIFIVLFLPYNIYGRLQNVNNFMLILFVLYFSRVIIKAALNKREGSHMMLLGMMILSITVMNDILYVSNINIPTFYGMTSYGIIIFIFIQAVILSKILLNAFRSVENLSQRLMSLDKLKDEFLANTSHELRTPLNGIIGISDSLVEGACGNISPNLKRNLLIISLSAKRLSNLVNDILDYSKLKHKDIQLNIKSVNLNEIVEVVLTIFNVSLINKSILIKNEIPKNISNVYADENRLQQIIYNLIGNAVKFTYEGVISIKAQEKDEFLNVIVEDTGIGIHEKDLKDIFESFEQVDTSISREHSGTGLGLSITKKLVGLQGGKIYCESELGKGSKFTFTLPLSKSKQENRVNKHDIENDKLVDYINENSLVNLETQNTKGEFKILIVDDEIVNLQVLINLLSLHNYFVVTAFNGNDALKLIENKKFDLIILDVMMPKMSGYEVCTIVRKKFSIVELPILMLTAKSRIVNICKGFECGANDYIIKPFEKIELLARIKTLLTMKNAVNLSIMDALTGIFNRRHIFELAEVIFDEYKNNKQPFSIIMMDIDYFKKVNDSYGHATGDKVLTEVALICEKAMRTTDILGRYGGEEFAAILPNTTINNALEIAERIRKNIENYPIIVDRMCKVNITLSLGVAQVNNEIKSVHDIFNEADIALYTAKSKGRNRTEATLYK